MEMPNASRAQFSDMNNVRQKHEQALALKQRWMQAYDVLDINLNNASLSSEENGEYRAQGLTNTVNDVKPNTPEISNANTASERFDKYFIGSRSVVNMTPIDIENNFELLSKRIQSPHGYSSKSDIKNQIDQTTNNHIQLEINSCISTKQAMSLTLANGYSRYEIVSDLGVVNEKATQPVFLTKNQACETINKPSQIFLSKSEDGFTILARDYRIDTNFSTRKLIDSLKTIILANGTLKKILMNGKIVS